MIDVKFYSFSKKLNSTKTPSDSGTTYSCKLLSPTSMQTPSIELDIGRTTSPTYNYAYIADFDRYYFVTNWVYASPLWTADLTVDVLASWKTEIGNTTTYVLRSTSSYDGDIMDNMYTVKVEPTVSVTEIVSGGYDFSDGYYIVQVVGANAFSSAPTLCYQFTAANFRTLVDALMQSSTGLDFSDFTNAVQSTIYQPFNFITGCFWIPYALTPYTYYDEDEQAYTSNIPDFYAGLWHLAVDCELVFVPYGLSTNYIKTTTIPKHSLASTRGDYMNMAPFTRYELRYEPFGVINLDGSLMEKYTTLYTQVMVDPYTGIGTLEVRGIPDTPDGTYTLIASVKAQYGVPIAFNVGTKDTLGTITDVIGTVTDVVNKDYIGAMVGAIGTVQSALNGTMHNVSSQGSIAAMARGADLFAYFYTPADEDVEHFGRPLCQKVTLNTLSGYIQCADGDVEAAATDGELAQIRSYLEGGFFYE